MAESEAKSQNVAAIVFAVFAAACVAAFLAFRGSDIGQLPKLVGNLGGGDILGDTPFALAGLVIGNLILIAWLGSGRQIFRLFGFDFGEGTSIFLLFAVYGAIGAAAYSALWFFAGIAGGYSWAVAVVFVVIGVLMQLLPGKGIANVSDSDVAWWKGRSIGEWLILAFGVVPVTLALVASLAPPTAKDSLLYHFAVPKAFIAQHSSVFIEGNIASYLALGAEMHSIWAMLLGNLLNPIAGEAAAGVTGFLFFPLLLFGVYGWSRQIGISRLRALMATLIVATVPTAYHVASSGYIDVSLALYVTLATYALTRWWKEQTWGWAILIAIFLGAALSIKLTTVFVIAAFALIVLLRARETKHPVAPGSDTYAASSAGRVVLTGFAALLLAGAIASPWYLRTWAATGSPVFPFYMSIWPGKANGWDIERSNLFQAMNSQYGGTDVNKVNYLTAPVRVSVAAQPEQPANYDGVLGMAFLIGLPLLIWALWKLDLAVGIKIMTGVAGIMYLFWLFSSEQLRYLLPIIPVLAIAIAASAEKISGAVSRVAKVSLVAASVCGLLTTVAWFCQKAPLRVVLGGETRDQYLTRNLDYYPYYRWLNEESPADAKVWLINMRRDTYHLYRPYFSDYLFEDWTLRHMVWEARSVEDLRAKTAAMGVQYVLARHDFLFDYDRTTLVDEKRSRTENEAKVKIAREFILDPQRTIKTDNKFSLVKVF